MEVNMDFIFVIPIAVGVLAFVGMYASRSENLKDACALTALVAFGAAAEVHFGAYALPFLFVAGTLLVIADVRKIG